MRSRRNSAAWWLVIAAGCACFAQVPSQSGPPKPDEKPASLGGEVRNAITGMPVERAHVSLRRYNNNGFDKYGALTNAEGKFSIGGIPADAYQVTVDRVGFVAPLESTRNSMTLKAGEKRDNFKLKLIPVGAISGRVLDADGQPMDGITVEAQQGGRQQRTGVTDDRGQYRIGGLAPGKYRVRAVPQNLPLPPEIRTDGTAEVYYGATYHPGAIDEKGGARVLVGAATDVTGVDIRMVRVPIVRVAGKVSGIPEGAKYVLVQLTTSTGHGTQSGQVKPDGSFEIWRSNPGKYTVRAIFNNSGEQIMSGPVEIEVGESDVENIGLMVLPSEDIHGQLEFDDEAAKQGPKPPPGASRPGASSQSASGSSQSTPQPVRRVTLRENGTMGQTRMGSVNEDGTFTVNKVPPGKYQVSLQGYLAFVQSTRLGNVAHEGPILDLTHGSAGAPVSITVSSAFGEISGTVQDDKGPAAGARLVLSDDSGFPAPGPLRGAIAGQDGTYTIKSVPPGKYKLMVIDESETRTMTSEPNSDDYDERAESVEVRPKDVLTRDLKLRPVK